MPPANTVEPLVMGKIANRGAAPVNLKGGWIIVPFSRGVLTRRAMVRRAMIRREEERKKYEEGGEEVEVDEEWEWEWEWEWEEEAEAEEEEEEEAEAEEEEEVEVEEEVEEVEEEEEREVEEWEWERIEDLQNDVAIICWYAEIVNDATGVGRYCSPRHPTYFEPSPVDFNGI